MNDKTMVLIQDVQHDPVSRCWRIAQLITAPDGASHRILHQIPDYAAVNRAAEYDLDPQDSRLLIDWMLHERFAPQDDQSLLCPYLNHPGVAWDRHRSRLVEIKSRIEIADPGGHLERIHSVHRPGQAEILAARSRVAAVRAQVAHVAGRTGSR